MFRKLKIFTLINCLLALIIGFVGTTLLNTKSWNHIKEDFHSSKSEQVNFFISETQESITALVSANAPWTDLQEQLIVHNTDWLEVNATGYLVQNESFKIDFVMAATEDLSYINQYGDAVLEPVMQAQSFLRALVENKDSSEIIWINEMPMFIVTAPITNNDYENPMGVYVLGRWLSEENLQDLKRILGEDILKSLVVTKEKMYTGLMTRDYSILEFSYPVEMDESIDYINLEFKTPLYRNIFYVQKLHTLVVILITGLIFLTIWFLYFKKLSNGVTEVIDAVKRISSGDYDVKVMDSEIEEVSELVLSVNRMATDITSHIHEIDNSYVSMIEVMANSVEINDAYTSHHNMRVANFARVIGELINFEDIKTLNIAARLHDIGKISIPTEIINKPGKLTAEEYEIIKEHPLAGFQIMDNIDFFKEIKLGVLYHHERYDGKGYPEGLRGEDIPLIAQIISVADVFDALASDRPYRKAYGYLESLGIIRENSGTMFNPIIVEAFVGYMEELYNLCQKSSQ